MAVAQERKSSASFLSFNGMNSRITAARLSKCTGLVKKWFTPSRRAVASNSGFLYPDNIMIGVLHVSELFFKYSTIWIPLPCGMFMSVMI
jgi:hypothetical protein